MSISNTQKKGLMGHFTGIPHSPAQSPLVHRGRVRLGPVKTLRLEHVKRLGPVELFGVGENKKKTAISCRQFEPGVIELLRQRALRPTYDNHFPF